MNIKGFGGIFWRTNDINHLKTWYSDVFGFSMEEWNGTVISPKQDNKTVFSFLQTEDDYFPLNQAVMLNFQVESMVECEAHLQKLGIPLVKSKEVSEFGTFIWIKDPEGRWIELWEAKP